MTGYLPPLAVSPVGDSLRESSFSWVIFRPGEAEFHGLVNRVNQRNG